jgi:hypothetical protein
MQIWVVEGWVQFTEGFETLRERAEIFRGMISIEEIFPVLEKMDKHGFIDHHSLACRL